MWTSVKIGFTLFIAVAVLGSACSTRILHDATVLAERRTYCSVAWVTQVSSAKAIQDVSDSCSNPRWHRRVVNVDASAVDRLQGVMERNRFLDLPEWIYFHDASGQVMVGLHADQLCIEKLGPKRHRVCTEPAALTTSEEGARFSNVWKELIATVPEP
jgi:hypothetical protein